MKLNEKKKLMFDKAVKKTPDIKTKKKEKHSIDISEISKEFHMEIDLEYFGSEDARITFNFYFFKNQFEQRYKPILKRIVQFKIIPVLGSFRNIKSFKKNEISSPKKKIVVFKTNMPSFNKGMWICCSYDVIFKQDKKKMRSENDLTFMITLTKKIRNKLLKYYDDIQIKIKHSGIVATVIFNEK